MTNQAMKRNYFIKVLILCCLICAGYASSQSNGAAIDADNSIEKKFKGPVKLQSRVATSPPSDKSKSYSSAGRIESTLPAQPSKDKFRRYSSVSVTIERQVKPIEIIIPPRRPDQDSPDYSETPDDEPALGEETDMVEIEKKLKSIPPIPPNIKQYLEDKYVSLDDLPSVTLQMTPYGQQIESIYIRGDITPKDTEKAARFWKAKNEQTREDKARSLAKAFLEEEADLLGIIDINELYETEVKTNEYNNGIYTDIYYVRKIGNIELEKSYINIAMGPNETISAASANIIHVTPELSHAAKKKTLSKEKIYNIIKRDLKRAKPDMPVVLQILETKKVALPKPPYIIWKVRVARVAPLKIINSPSPQSFRAPLPGEEEPDVGWNYRIDAFTGEILDKQSAIQR